MISIKGIAKKPITDATASSDDVGFNKVFYNNNGRQVGSSKYIPSKKYQLSVSASDVSATTSIKVNYVYMYSSNHMSGVFELYSDSDYGSGTTTFIDPLYLYNYTELGKSFFPIKSINVDIPPNLYTTINLGVSTYNLRIYVNRNPSCTFSGNICLNTYVKKKSSVNDPNLFIGYTNGTITEIGIGYYSGSTGNDVTYKGKSSGYDFNVEILTMEE